MTLAGLAIEVTTAGIESTTMFSRCFLDTQPQLFIVY
jgi:hypothetical protein